MKLLPRKSGNTDTDTSLQLPGSQVSENFAWPMRLGVVLLIFGFGGFMAWAGLAPLGKGEPATGVVEVAGHRKVVQHLYGGTVAAIEVHNGEKVEAGEVLLRLNPTKALAERNSVSAQYIVASVTEDRLVAEATGQDEITFDPKVRKRFGDDPRYQRAVKIQKRLFNLRREALEGQISIIREKIEGARSRIDKLEKVIDNRKQQINHIQEQLEGVRSLAKKGYVPRNRMLELERKAASLQAQLFNDMVQLGETRNHIKELKLKILQAKREFRKQAQAKLSEIQEKTARLAARLSALDYAVKQTTIRAPISGIVQNLQVHTIGGTIKPGSVLMSIVPKDAEYVVRAKLPVSNITHIQEGLPVEITFPALSSVEVPGIPGEVKTVSASRIEDKQTKVPYYSIEVAITDKGMRMLEKAGASLRPGMPAMVMIQLGERTMLSYLFQPLLERLGTSFTE